jgi:hypothetical protein
MTDPLASPCTAFAGHRCIASGPLGEVALAIKAHAEAGQVTAFDDRTGRVLDLDLRGTDAEVLARLGHVAAGQHGAGDDRSEPGAGVVKRSRGRPRLGVVAREVTLLPRHWDWLAEQPGGASNALRRLVDEARRNDGGQAQVKRARERAYRFLTAQAGDLPGYEEVIRGLFSGDHDTFTAGMAQWPPDLTAYALKLAQVDPAREEQ